MCSRMGHCCRTFISRLPYPRMYTNCTAAHNTPRSSINRGSLTACRCTLPFVAKNAEHTSAHHSDSYHYPSLRGIRTISQSAIIQEHPRLVIPRLPLSFTRSHSQPTLSVKKWVPKHQGTPQPCQDFAPAANILDIRHKRHCHSQGCCCQTLLSIHNQGSPKALTPRSYGP